MSLVLDNGGSLKAEHGTGRVMAPFVRRQYGDELYDVMRSLKRLFDPRGLLNPGVLISDDPDAHLRHIKLAPHGRGGGRPLRRVRLLRAGVPVARPHPDPAPADRAPPGHPQRRAGRGRRHGRSGSSAPTSTRAWTPARSTGCAPPRARSASTPDCWSRRSAARTCPTPVGGRLDRGRHSTGARRRRWPRPPSRWPRAVPGPLSAATAVGRVAARRRHGAAVDPRPASRRGVPPPSSARRRPPDAVYLPACVNVMFGPAEGPGVQVAFEDLCAAAGLTLLVPDGIDSLCCGTPWSSKGVVAGVDGDARSRCCRWCARPPTAGGCRSSATPRRAPRASGTCSGDEVQVIDVVAFVAERVLPVLGPYERLSSLTLHPTCSSTQLGLDPALRDRRRGRRRDRHRAARLGLLRVRRRPRDAAPGAHRRRRPGARPRRLSGSARRRTLAATAPASSA